MRVAAQAHPQAEGPERGPPRCREREGSLAGLGGWQLARKLTHCRRGWGVVPPPLCGCPLHSWRGWLDRGECGHALSGSGDACSTEEAPRTLISPGGPGPAKTLGQKRELASQRRARQVHLPLSWGSPGKRGLLPGPTREGGRVVETAAKQQTAGPRGPQAQAQASPRLRGKHGHTASRRS